MQVPVKKETFALHKINNPEIIRMRKMIGEFGSGWKSTDSAFADVLNRDTTYNRISKDV